MGVRAGARHRGEPAGPGRRRSRRDSPSGPRRSTPRTLAETLQRAGVDAAPVLDLADLHDDPQLAHRRHFRTVEHPVLGAHPAETHAIRFSDMEPALRRPAPKLGEHTDQVLRDLLDMADDEIVRLRAAGVLD